MRAAKCYFIILFLNLVSISPLVVSAQLVVGDTPGVEAKLYLGLGMNQPLVVGLGGSEGGNAWDSDYWKKTRDEFIDKGYAFLALGYFGAPGTPDSLERIAIDHVHAAILKAADVKGVDKKNIAIVGGSRGGDLALLLASYNDDIRCVVAIVPSHVAFPGNTSHLSSSAWTYRGKELPFVPVNEAAVPFLLNRDLRAVFETMLTDTVAERAAAIPVERINGPVLFLSATRDQIAPTTPMCEKMMQRLKANKFSHHYEHIAVEGMHSAPLNHFAEVFNFLDRYFKPTR